ncbi:MAG: hypothetical protein PHU71_06520 [Candidatus Gracilibacteria bacterium]|nr:hypothetical protein [Candidatus Gracilibacteria bacterium]
MIIESQVNKEAIVILNKLINAKAILKLVWAKNEEIKPRKGMWNENINDFVQKHGVEYKTVGIGYYDEIENGETQHMLYFIVGGV